MSSKSLQYYLEFLKLSGIQDIFLDNKNSVNPAGEKIDLQTKKKFLTELEENYQNCEKCGLHSNRIRFVYGEGNADADLMLIGEGPGAEENATGKPFVGKAGKLLTKMLQAIKIDRDEVYITNVVKCRPPNNRNPLPEEISTCSNYLNEQINIIQPGLLLLLGKVAAVSLLNLDQTLTKFRERTYSYKGIKTYVTYHPSALLRNRGWKKPAWIDLQKLQKDYQAL